jgi:hypothetical protein
MDSTTGKWCNVRDGSDEVPNREGIDMKSRCIGSSFEQGRHPIPGRFAHIVFLIVLATGIHSQLFAQGPLGFGAILGAAFGFATRGYFTGGGRTYFTNDADLGFDARAVVGLSYTIPRSPVDTFFEMAPLIIAAPGPGFGIDVALGARVYS